MVLTALLLGVLVAAGALAMDVGRAQLAGNGESRR
jgi:hypothetical protein